jgi:DNA-directed RNA polymerase subunit RPC12/RpoP
VYDVEIECNHCGDQIEITKEIADYLEHEYEPAYPEFCAHCEAKFEKEESSADD